MCGFKLYLYSLSGCVRIVRVAGREHYLKNKGIVVYNGLYIYIYIIYIYSIWGDKLSKLWEFSQPTVQLNPNSTLNLSRLITIYESTTITDEITFFQKTTPDELLKVTLSEKHFGLCNCELLTNKAEVPRKITSIFCTVLKSCPFSVVNH